MRLCSVTAEKASFLTCRDTIGASPHTGHRNPRAKIFTDFRLADLHQGVAGGPLFIVRGHRYSCDRTGVELFLQ